jgi:hypothetical protein
MMSALPCLFGIDNGETKSSPRQAVFLGANVAIMRPIPEEINPNKPETSEGATSTCLRSVLDF